MSSQDVITIPPLFEYPVPPEDLEDITSRCNYLVSHFWENFNFNQKQSVDQNALNHAFQVYITAASLADKTLTFKEIDKLIGKISKNPTLLVQFAKAAEDNLYGPRADFWQDDLYLKFAETIAKNKKVGDSRRRKYTHQANILKNTHIGNQMPEFEFINSANESKKYFPMSTPTLLIFADPENIDWRMQRMKLDTDSKLNQALEKGKLNVIFISTSSSDNWIKEVSAYPNRWTTGCNPNIEELIDIRISPSCYVIGSDGKIINKNIPVERGLQTIMDQIIL